MEGINDETQSWRQDCRRIYHGIAYFVVMGGYAYYKAVETGDHLENIQRASLRGGAAGQAQESYLSAIMATRGYMAYGNESFVKQIDEKFNESLKYADEAMKAARRPEIKAAIEQFKVNVGKHKEGIQVKLLPAVQAYHQEKNSPTASLAKNEGTGEYLHHPRS